MSHLIVLLFENKIIPSKAITFALGFSRLILSRLAKSFSKCKSRLGVLEKSVLLIVQKRNALHKISKQKKEEYLHEVYTAPKRKSVDLTQNVIKAETQKHKPKANHSYATNQKCSVKSSKRN